MVLHQVNKILRGKFLSQAFRLFSTTPGSASKILYPLPTRSLLNVSGEEVSPFLQGLITNDMRHFEEGASSIYCMFLNNKGRVLYDTLIYKWNKGHSFLIECDNEVSESLQKHLKLYKLKRKLQIINLEEYNIMALVVSKETNLKLDLLKDSKLNVYKDPRLGDLGYRIIAPASIDGSTIAKTIGADVTFEKSDENYKYLRYKLGVSEGAQDIPLGSSFPLEVNCDYLHGVSFHKGCYIGQELTARVFHTGVIRKRIMPVKFIQTPEAMIEADSIVIDVNKPNSSVGKLKGQLRDSGLGLIRIKEAMEAKELKIGNHQVEILKPTWWPIEAPKEKLDIN